MKTRTYEEMKAYIDGYNACYKQYNEILSNDEEPFYIRKRIEKMKVFVSAVNGVLEREQISGKENNETDN